MLQLVKKVLPIRGCRPACRDPTPSRADIEMRRVIVDVAKPLGITVHERQARPESPKGRNNFRTNIPVKVRR